MEAKTTNGLTELVLLSVLAMPVSFALTSTAAMAAGSWQQKQLFEPGETQLKRERMGRVTIYSGFTDVQVAQAMEQQFDRVEHMMFVGTVVTASDGEPKTEQRSGEVQTEDDGC